MSRDHTRYIHRVWTGHGERDSFEVGGLMWQELNPDWGVLEWTDEVEGEFPYLARVFRSLEGHPERLASVIGAALVAKWGGVYVSGEIEPTKPLPDLMPDEPWIADSGMFGSGNPADPFWVDLLMEVASPYFEKLKDSDLTELIVRHSVGQLSLFKSRSLFA